LSADRDAPYRALVAVMDTARTDHEGAPLFELVTLAVQAPPE
jgi:biopolymer transport protein ExbD